jgi:hypothetical protein
VAAQVFLDDVLVYKGNLRPSPTKEMYVSTDLSAVGAGEEDVWWVRLDDRASLKGASQKEAELDLSQTILFTNDLAIIATEVCLSLSLPPLPDESHRRLVFLSSRTVSTSSTGGDTFWWTLSPPSPRLSSLGR